MLAHFEKYGDKPTIVFARHSDPERSEGEESK
jgi:hypothetical protein